MKKLLSCLFFMLCCGLSSASAHEGVRDLENLSKSETLWIYLQAGFSHIIPLGLDHILFIICLFLGSRNLRTLALQATMFTMAHTLTLGLSMFKLVNLPPSIIEPIISASIVFMALQLLMGKSSTRGQLITIFLFGLVHGLGFAGALQDYGMPKEHFLSALLVFNVGVEFGQLSVIIMAYLLIGWWSGKWNGYRRWIIVPGAVVIAMVAGWWTIERLVVS